MDGLSSITFLTSMQPEMKDGTLLMPLCISGDHTIRPNNHTANWVGEQPCDIKGKPLPSLVNTSGQQVSVKGVRSNFFSHAMLRKRNFLQMVIILTITRR